MEGVQTLLEGKSALVTGAGKNIGRAIALELAAAGAHVYFTDIDETLVRNVEKELSANSRTAKGFRADITREEDSERVISYFREKNIPLDILVNNVGVRAESSGEAMLDADEFRRVFETNVFGPLELTRRVISLMKSNQTTGSIVFISSIHQSIVSRWLSYGASKAALEMLIKELAIEVAGFGIRVNGIAPGYIASDDEGQPIPHGRVPLHQQSIPQEYIGKAAVFLSSEHFSRHTTGSILTVDAGLSLFNHRVAQQPPEQP